jgi:aldehyde:ferredoxin oxidoreductase
MNNGYMGKILKVDLSKHRLEDGMLDEELARQFLGGYGIAARIIFNEQTAEVDPLGPDNILCFATGLFTGTQAISGTRYTVAGKSPLTGCWGDANSGGYFGAFLKFAGYDAIFITGMSEQPTYLFINNGDARLKDASHLWGKDTYETEDILKSQLGDDIGISCIGQAGEKLALISAIVHNKGSVAGRAGLGAVMGSKKLKAVAVRGNMAVPVADAEKLNELRAKYVAKLGGHVNIIRKYGTTFYTVNAAKSGDSPVKNWGGVAKIDFPEVEPIGGDPILARQLKKKACYHCPVGCEALMKEGKGEYQYEAGSFRPEYETIAMLGVNCLNNNLESVIKANDLCNRYGIDTISAGAVIAFTMECYEKGLINQKDTDGIEMKWGNHKSLVAMTKKIALREGFGDTLADGVQVAAQKIGKGADNYAIHIGGQEVPGHSPVHSFHWTATYIANATPARHTQGSEGFIKGFLPEFDPKSFKGRGAAHRVGVCLQHVQMCSGMCIFVFGSLPSPGVYVMADFMRAVTGWDITTDEIITTGERIANMRQVFNIREGINLQDFKIPGRVFGRPPYKNGPRTGITVDYETQVNEYLAEMDWDLKTARPSKKRLTELGLGDVAQKLG